jgi:hypothetical protein
MAPLPAPGQAGAPDETGSESDPAAHPTRPASSDAPAVPERPRPPADAPPDAPQAEVPTPAPATPDFLRAEAPAPAPPAPDAVSPASRAADAAPPSLSIGHIDVIFEAPPPAPAPDPRRQPVQRTRGFERYDRVRLGLRR